MGATNEPCGAPPEVGGPLHLPPYPQANEPVSVTATITDDGIVVTATLWYSADLEFGPVAMTGLGGGMYQGTIPGQPDGAWVRYYVAAEDNAGQTTTNPTGAPEQAYSYVAGFPRQEIC